MQKVVVIYPAENLKTEKSWINSRKCHIDKCTMNNDNLSRWYRVSEVRDDIELKGTKKRQQDSHTF